MFRPPRPRATLVLATLLALAAAGTGSALATSSPRTAAAPKAALAPAAGALTWADDFDGPAGSAPNGARWRHDIGGSGWGNQELEYYTDSTRNAALDGNGHLVITARKENPGGFGCWYGSCQYTSARLLTAGTFSQQYGRFEARIQIPRGQGMWPAFWMLGDNIGSVGWPNSGEIDVMENIGREPATIHGTLHGPGYSGGAGLSGGFTLGGGAFADGFHTFAVDWDPTGISFSVDAFSSAAATTSSATPAGMTTIPSRSATIQSPRAIRTPPISSSTSPWSTSSHRPVESCGVVKRAKTGKSWRTIISTSRQPPSITAPTTPRAFKDVTESSPRCAVSRSPVS